MKKIIKNIGKKARYWCAWLFSRKVMDAINSGASFDEVEALAREIAGETSPRV